MEERLEMTRTAHIVLWASIRSNYNFVSTLGQTEWRDEGGEWLRIALLFHPRASHHSGY